MSKDSTNNSQFSMEQLRQVLSSKEGKQLIALLNRDGGKALQQAAQAYKSGDTAGAEALLKPMVQTGEGTELLKKLGRK